MLYDQVMDDSRKEASVMRINRLYAVLAIGLLFVLPAAGCRQRVRIELPPAAPVADMKTIAILDFTNASVDPGIGMEFADYLSTVVQQSGLYTVLDRAATAAVLAKNNITAAEAADPDTAVKLGQLLQCDALVTGEVTHYLEDVSIDIPYRVGSTADGKTPSWYSGTATRVNITVRVRIVDARTGAVIWTKRVSEGDEAGATKELNWHFDSPPPESLLPKPAKTDVPRVRQNALEKVVQAVAADIFPGYRYEWRQATPTESVPATPAK